MFVIVGEGGVNLTQGNVRTSSPAKKIPNGSIYLGTHLAANDYYHEGEHVTGPWVEKGAELLGIGGPDWLMTPSGFADSRLALDG